MERKDDNDDELEKLEGKAERLSVEIEGLNAKNDKLNVEFDELHVEIDLAESLYRLLASDECASKNLSEKLKYFTFMYEAIDHNASERKNMNKLRVFLAEKNDLLKTNADQRLKNKDLLVKNKDLLVSPPREFTVLVLVHRTYVALVGC